jgi:hypothetical protein
MISGEYIAIAARSDVRSRIDIYTMSTCKLDRDPQAKAFSPAVRMRSDSRVCDPGHHDSHHSILTSHRRSTLPTLYTRKGHGVAVTVLSLSYPESVHYLTMDWREIPGRKGVLVD